MAEHVRLANLASWEHEETAKAVPDTAWFLYGLIC